MTQRLKMVKPAEIHKTMSPGEISIVGHFITSTHETSFELQVPCSLK